MDELISYFLSLPDQVLTYIVFPKLPLDIIGKLCPVHTKFNNICQNDILWQIKSFNDFPNLINHKSSTSTWRNFYFSNIKYVPVVHDDQIIGHIFISSNEDIDAIKSIK